MVKKALIVAIDNYVSPYTMYSNVNDGEDLKNTLINKGYSVTTIYNSSATKSNVLNGIYNLIVNRIVGDHICFAFFGHGSKARYSGESDGTAECLCAYNWVSGGIIWDFEIEPIFRNVNCEYDLVFGSCFSGGIGEYDRGRIWQACGENESAWSGILNGKWHGIFPAYLCWMIRNRPYSNALNIYNEVYVNVLRTTSNQHCVLRGSNDSIMKVPFGGII